ncbi:UNVERIFIED_CONTAM: hypothetical protein H355_002792 [Colinus virginianus]|nr:hypothetical protein H355_002792 [Colinus virginianus]
MIDSSYVFLTFRPSYQKAKRSNPGRFQTHAVSNLQIIFFLWNIVSGNVKKFAIEDKYFQELNGFLHRNQNFSIKEFTRENGFYLNGSTLLECEFFGKTCHPKDFEHVFTEYGNCFTFNYNDLPARRVSLSGRGLHLLFDVQQEQFTDDPALGYTDSGITFVIHSPKETPRFDGLGLLTPVGMHAQVAIQQLKSIIQEYPWGECKPDIKLQYQDTYSTNGCLQECKAWYIQDWCGCLPFILPGNGAECDLMKSYNCVFPAILILYVFVIRQNLVIIDIKYDDLSYRITQQQKALTVSELLGKGMFNIYC